MESTTFEIIEKLKQVNDFTEPVIEKVKQILQLADMVKFAKRIPLPQDNENALNSGIEFIRETTIPVNEKPRTEV